MSIGSSWQPTSAYERFGENFPTRALEIVHEGDWGRLKVRRAELSVALDALSTRNAALRSTIETVHCPADRLRLHRELDAYQAYQKENRARLTTLPEGGHDHDAQLSELLLALIVRVADEYLSEALAELAVADGVQAHAALRSRQALDFIGDGGRAHWNDCLTTSAKYHSMHSRDTMEIARGVRQLLVHHSGIVTRDFIATYPQFPAAVDTRVRIPDEFTLDLASSVGSLVSAADHAIAHRIARAGGNGCPLRDP